MKQEMFALSLGFAGLIVAVQAAVERLAQHHAAGPRLPDRRRPGL